TLGALCEGLASNGWTRMGAPDQAVLLIDTLNIYGTLHIANPESGNNAIWQLPLQTPSVRYVAPETTRGLIAADSTRLSVDPAWLTLEDWCGFFDVDPFADPLGHLLSVVVDHTQQKWQVADRTPGTPETSGIADLLDTLDQ